MTTRIVCDTCEKVGVEHSPYTHDGPRRRGLDRDWAFAAIQFSNGPDNNETSDLSGHFCSRDCLNRWVESL